jgi:hypothetical protein
MSNREELPKSPPGADLTRRQVLTYLGAAGALAGGAPLASAAQPERAEVRRGQTVGHTLFFNFSHESDAASAQYFLLARGRRYAVDPIRNHAVTLAEARRSSAFLRRIPDDAVTHAVKGVVFADNAVHLCYVLKNPDTDSGTWAMSSVFFQLPAASILEAHARAVDRLGTGSLPVSAKRQLYGLEAAAMPRDMLEEHALKDSSDHAAALIGVHPELMSIDPKSCAYVHETYIRTNRSIFPLSQVLQRKGAATPQPGGWATLTELKDGHGNTIRNKTGHNKGLNQYHPVWDAEVSQHAGSIIPGVVQPVKDDTSLGADVTGRVQSIEDPALRGKLWVRRDGFTTVDQSPGAAVAAENPVKLKPTTNNTEAGYTLTGDARLVDGKVQATLTLTNWFVRFLGIWVLFLNNQDQPLTIEGLKFVLPDDYDPQFDAGQQLAFKEAHFALLLGPEFTLLGVPFIPAIATVGFEVPDGASKIRVFASGPNPSNNLPPDPLDIDTWGDPIPGWIATVVITGVTFLCAAAGVAEISPLIKAALPLMASVATALVTEFGDLLRGNMGHDATAWKGLGIAVVKALITTGAQGGLGLLLDLIVQAISLGVLEDSAPVAGFANMILAAAVGVATIAETTIEILVSPRSYIYDLDLTHDLSVTIKHADNDQSFPEAADYYKMTALFDGGTPHVKTLNMPSRAPAKLDAIVFTDVPRGGQVNVSVGFYSRSSDPSQNDWLCGKGTTGLVDNTVDVLQPGITIEQFQVPIKSDTRYVHDRKTTLDESGKHVWHVTKSGPTIKQRDITCESQPGILCSFRGITVRQGTSSAPGYVGYAWQGYSPNVVQCGSSGQGQLDQIANMGVLDDPQAGYVTAGCGFPSGVQLFYSLLTHSSSNFYLDPMHQLIRRVQLDPPTFDSPTIGEAWGALNLPSDALLLHPSGRFVSINTANHKIEVLRIPDKPKGDDEARQKLLASVHSGLGSRPDLIDSPRAAAISPDGVILILEAGNNNRLQAFDLGGNAVQFFKKQKSPYFLNLTDTAGGDTVYLDLAVEFTGYLYVLSFDQGTNDYRLDIYHPLQDGSHPISTTHDVNAARLTVDFWRNVYTLNYEVLRLPNGGSPDITEPSVSLWVPTPP